MLTYTIEGPTPTGRYLVVYKTPGRAGMTVAADCATIDGAREEAARLNRAQVQKEKGIRDERALCGIRGTHASLKGKK